MSQNDLIGPKVTTTTYVAKVVLKAHSGSLFFFEISLYKVHSDCRESLYGI